MPYPATLNTDSALEGDDKDDNYKTVSYYMVCQLQGEEMLDLN